MSHRTTVVFSLLVLTSLASCGGKGGNSSTGLPPSGLSYERQSEDQTPQPIERTSGMLRVAISTLRAQISGEVTHWSITPALPEGLLLDASSGDISGVPLAEHPRTQHTVTASNAYGSVSTQLEIVIERTPRYLYLASPSDSTVSILGLDVEKGTLQRRGFAALPPALGTLEGFQPHRSGRFGYSTTTGGYLVTWSIDPLSGWMQALTQDRIGFGDSHQLALSPDGEHLYLACQGGQLIVNYAIDPETGMAQKTGGGLELGMQPRALCFDENGTRLFAALSNGNASQVVALERAEDGALSALSGGLTLASTEPADLVFDPRRSQLLVSMRDSSSILRLPVEAATGAIALADSLTVGLQVGDLELDALGWRLYASDVQGNRTHVLDFTEQGALRLGESLEGGEGTSATFVDPMLRHVMMLDAQAHQLRTASGSLTPKLNWNLRGQPASISVLRGEGPLRTEIAAVLASAELSGAIMRYQASPVDGTLTLLEDIQETPGRGCFTIEPRQRFLYVIDPNTQEIEGYRLDKNSGQLIAAISRMPVQGIPTYITADASGRYLYGVAREVNTSDDGRLNTYAIDQESGALTLIDSAITDYNPVYVGVEPSGMFLYVANNGNGTPGSATITIYDLDAHSGLPMSSAPSQMAPGAWGLAFPASGRIVYAALRNSNITVPFRISFANGGLSLAGPGVRAGFEPISIAVTPDERSIYVAYKDTESYGHVAHFRISDSGTLIAPGDLYQEGYQPTCLDIDPQGKFLYSANAGTSDLSVFQIGEAGLLYPRTPAPCGQGASFVGVLERFQ
jgi:6-phosphogluconolactonase (cycloisomerase 2 family)